jgi:hypothetical protein
MSLINRPDDSDLNGAELARTLNRAELTRTLHSSPSVEGPSARAAVDLLVNACNGELPLLKGFDRVVHMEGDVAHIRWAPLSELADDIERQHYYAGVPHPDAAVVLRIAYYLGSGGITDANKALIRQALGEQP